MYLRGVLHLAASSGFGRVLKKPLGERAGHEQLLFCPALRLFRPRGIYQAAASHVVSRRRRAILSYLSSRTISFASLWFVPAGDHGLARWRRVDIRGPRERLWGAISHICFLYFANA